jgi:hypothetical protein
MHERSCARNKRHSHTIFSRVSQSDLGRARLSQPPITCLKAFFIRRGPIRCPASQVHLRCTWEGAPDATNIPIASGGPAVSLTRTEPLQLCLNDKYVFQGGASETSRRRRASSTRRRHPHSRASSRAFSTASQAFSPPLPASSPAIKSRLRSLSPPQPLSSFPLPPRKHASSPSYHLLNDEPHR